MTTDVRATVDFYRTNLGFELVMAVAETKDGILSDIPEDTKIIYALLKNGNVEIMFQSQESLVAELSLFENIEVGASMSLYVEVERVEDFCEKLKSNQVEIVKDLFTTWYGMKEIYIRDNNGYIFCFAERA